jgi:hypothetical protein
MVFFALDSWNIGVNYGSEMYRIIGAVLIIVGLYLVLWGKSEERKFAQEKAAIQSTPELGNNRATGHIKPSLTQPLLPPSSSENV